jgi:hypothetical protein
MTINRLVDKLMSRNYGDYVAAQKYGDAKAEPFVVKTEDEPVEELNTIFGLGPN